jgi:hypothetical protein
MYFLFYNKSEIFKERRGNTNKGSLESTLQKVLDGYLQNKITGSW